jgi:hypothetical protein
MILHAARVEMVRSSPLHPSPSPTGGSLVYVPILLPVPRLVTAKSGKPQHSLAVRGKILVPTQPLVRLLGTLRTRFLVVEYNPVHSTHDDG